MANGLEKLLDIISKVASIQQLSNGQQPSNIQNSMFAENKSASRENNTQTQQSKTIYITKEDLETMFPSLKGKLDITNLISNLTSKSSLAKLISSLGIISVNTTEETTKKSGQVKSEDS